MTTLSTLRADLAGRVRARLEEADRLDPVTLEIRDVNPPCVLVGIASVSYPDGTVTVPVHLLSPGPANGDAVTWLEDSLAAVTTGGPLGPYRAVTADPGLYDLGDRGFPQYLVAYRIPAPPTMCRP